jgi:hypothetical protein
MGGCFAYEASQISGLGNGLMPSISYVSVRYVLNRQTGSYLLVVVHESKGSPFDMPACH